MTTTHSPRKRFGQNFLIDKLLILELIDIINPQANEHLVEIGPGQGALTTALIASKAQVDAIEIDRDLVAQLQQQYEKYSNFKLFATDILKFNLSSLFTGNSKPKNKLRLIGNLPYNISTPLLFKLFEEINVIHDMYFMLQREVALRLTAHPNTKDYGRMSIMAQYHCQMQVVLDVPPSAFEPAPKVDSCVVHFVPHAKPIVEATDRQVLKTVVTAAFNQRRKTIGNALKNIITAQELTALAIAPGLRAENLTIQQYATIANYMTTKQ